LHGYSITISILVVFVVSILEIRLFVHNGNATAENIIAAGTARAHATSNVGAANNHNSNNNSNERKSQFIK
jgi:hypothetical protein